MQGGKWLSILQHLDAHAWIASWQFNQQMSVASVTRKDWTPFEKEPSSFVNSKRPLTHTHTYTDKDLATRSRWPPLWDKETFLKQAEVAWIEAFNIMLANFINFTLRHQTSDPVCKRLFSVKCFVCVSQIDARQAFFFCSPSFSAHQKEFLKAPIALEHIRLRRYVPWGIDEMLRRQNALE